MRSRLPNPPVSLGRVLVFAIVGGAIVGFTWMVYVLTGLIDWYPIIFHTDSPPSPLLRIPFLGAIAGGCAVALRPIAPTTLRLIGVAFGVHGVLSVLIYGVLPATWFETQTPVHILFFGLGALATALGSIGTNPLRATAAAVVVGVVAMAIHTALVVGDNFSLDLYGGFGIAIAFWTALVLAATTDQVRDRSLA